MPRAICEDCGSLVEAELIAKVEAVRDAFASNTPDAALNLIRNAQIGRLKALHRIEELKSKLAQAVGALGDIYDGEPEWPDEPEKELEWCRNRAKRALAELKG